MYDVGGKLMNGIKSMYVHSLACVKVKGGESECFRINSGMRSTNPLPALNPPCTSSIQP